MTEHYRSTIKREIKLKVKKNRFFNVLMVSIMTMFILSACSGESNSSESKGEETKWEVSKETPIYADVEKKIVKVYATVNGKYLVNPTRHGLNWNEGKYGNQAVFNAYADPLDFVDALIKVDSVPAVDKGGDASKEFEETSDGKFIKGDKVDVSITWENAKKDYDINEVMVDSSGKDLVYRFGGNYDAAKKMVTGCFMCFDSCPVGVISNSNQAVGTFDSGAVEFRGNADILPEDGTPVVLTYSFVKGE